MEIWKPILSLNSDYEASSLGRIRRATPKMGTRSGRIRIPVKNKSNGRLYIIVTIRGRPKNFLVSRLICEAFYGQSPFDGAEVDHIDEDKLNNSAPNLQWISTEDNYKKHRSTERYKKQRKLVGQKVSKYIKDHHEDYMSSRPRGLSHWGSIHTEDQIRELLIDHKANPKIPITQLSKKHNVSYDTAWRCITGRGWTHIKF